jgi:galacturonosyltransferase
MSYQRKVLVLSNNCSGLANFRKEVIEAIINENHAITVAAPEDFKTNIITDMGCRFINLPFNRKGTNPIADFRLMLAYRKLIRRERPDVVLTYTIKPNVYGGMACRLAHTPQIANITGLGITSEKPGPLRMLTKVLYKMGLGRCHKVFFQNKENLDFCHAHHMISCPTQLIPGSGVNLERFSLQPYPTDNHTRFVFISRVQRRKGIEQYLQAAEALKAKYPDTEYHVVGACEEPEYTASLNRLSERGIVIYHGLVRDTRPILANIHCTVHPSFYPEGMSNVLQESCATGHPVITTDKAGCREIVNDGQTGYIVKQQDTDDLINKMEQFIQLPLPQKEDMGLRARAKMEREFNRDIVIKNYLDEIRLILQAT